MSSFNYISSSELKNFLSNDPLLDWLESYGHLYNYYPEKNDPDKIFNQFLQESHTKFQKKIIEHLESKLSITKIENHLDIRQRVSNTLNAFYLGKKIIYQGALFSNSHNFLSYPDLLIRSDLIPFLFPNLETVSESHSSKFNWTYYVVNIQTLKLHLNNEGYITNMNKRNQYLKAKNIIDTLCLNEIQECHNPLSFIISKSVQKSPDLKIDFKDFFYGRVDYQNYDQVIYENILKGCQWKQKLKQYGSEWSPEKTDPQQKEMYPNMVNQDDFPWHHVKKEIASKNQEITLLYHCGVKHRNNAFQHGHYQWSDCDSDSLQIRSTKKSKIIDKMIDLNKFQSEIEISPRILKNQSNRNLLRSETVEFYVDFETVINFNETSEDDNSSSHLFMIGCLCVLKNSNNQRKTQFKQFTCQNLDQESQIIDSWISYMNTMTSKSSKHQSKFKIYHWSHAEPVIMRKLSQKYSNKDLLPPQFIWTDLLQIFKNEPIILKDVFSYSLKPVVKKLHQLGLIETTWPQSEVMDGKNAMIYAWLYYTDKDNQPSDIMDQIEHYNFIDCQVLSEITSFLRTKI